MTTATAVSSLVFIDGSLPDIDTLRAAAPAGAEVFVLDATGDGIAQVAAIASRYSGLASIHVVSHGEAGRLVLGSAQLSSGSMAAYQSQLAAIGGALSSSGDLLLYGCDVAAGDIGQTFIDALALATGADVAASTDRTGAAARGGDWVLEARSGSVEAQSLEVGGYQGVLEFPDVPGGTATTTGLSLTGSVTGTIGILGDNSTKGDLDWYSLVLTSGITYRFALNQVAGAPLFWDPYFRLHNSAGTQVAFDDDSGGNANSLLTTTISFPLVGGTYYASAGAYNNAYTGDYILRAYRYQAGGVGNDNLSAAVSNNYWFEGNDGNDTLTGSSGQDNLLGGTGADSLVGNNGNDTLDGGTGADTMRGGDQDDTYYVDDAGDQVLNEINDGLGGFDQVFSSVTFTLPTALENLTLTGFNAINGTGSLNNNLITGNSANNSLDGGSGNDTLDGGFGIDTLIGGTGNDVFIVDSTSDTISDVSGTDRVDSSVTFSLAALGAIENLTLTGTGAIIGTGNDLNNVLTGNAGNNSLTGGLGNDTLDGGGGIDTLDGGDGDDVYVVDTTTDTITDSSGTDRVQSSAGFTLASLASIENLTLTGSAYEAIGNALNNTLIGNASDNYLDGVNGADTMVGGLGSDQYIINEAGDVITELAGEGLYDFVYSYISFTLPSEVEFGFLNFGSGGTITGNTLNNTLYGGGGNDTLDGSLGADTMDGQGGDDTYYVDNAGDATGDSGPGNDQVYASVSHTIGSGIELLTLTGANFINGTGNSSDNTITGNSAGNSLQGLAGNDTLLGNEGDDNLDGGIGNDSMVGGLGSDFYFVDSLSDVLVENAGEGSDWVYANLDYTLSTNFENLSLQTGSIGTGNSVDNTIYGNAGANTLYGLEGNDYLWGNSGNDTLYGSTGNDTIDGSSGADAMNGYDQDDIYYVDNVGDTIFGEINDGLGGFDTVFSSVTFTLPTALEVLTLTGGAAVNATGSLNNNTITGNNANNSLNGADGNDTLDGGLGLDTLIGGNGDDVFRADTTADTISDASGTDRVESSVTFSLASGLVSGVENLTLTGVSGIGGTGTAFNNVITGNTGNNSLDGGTGDDTLDGGAGVDTLQGGLSNDVFIVDTTTDTITDIGGTDRIDSSVSFSLASAFVTNVENLTLTGSANLTGTGNALANTLTGNSGNNTFDGGTGIDTLVGGLGDDIYVVDTSTDTITEAAGAGTDLVQSSATFSLSAIANIENLTLTGGGGVAGTGNALNNTITGNGANNVIDGGAGADAMIGGGGDDTYVVDNAGDVVTESAGAGTADTVQSSITFSIASFDNVERLTLTGSANIDGTGNTLANTLTGNSGNNLLTAGGGGDTIDGGTGADTARLSGNRASWTGPNISGTQATLNNGVDTVTLLGIESIQFDDQTIALNLGASLTGGAGNDTLNSVTVSGGAGNDTLNGLAGNDSLIGNAGDDIFDSAFGNSGNDTMVGGSGSDFYYVDSTSDVITELAGEGDDWILFKVNYGAVLPNNVEYAQLDFGSTATTITGNTLDNILYGNSRANLMTGGAGNDVLYGYADTLTLGFGDTMVGGTGDDFYYVQDTIDNITELTGEGSDFVYADVGFNLGTNGANVESLYLFDSAGAASATGNSLDNTIWGNSFANVVDGSLGADTVYGYGGNDTFIVDNSGDVVVEYFNEGTDTVNASVSHSLSANIENLLLTGGASIDGTGNELNNILTGNGGNNVLDGGAGNDTMDGNGGDDTYVVDSVSDIVNDTGGGIDTILANVNWTLGSDIENLTLTGAAIVGVGNAQDNVVTGNALDNTILGGVGNDTLKGGGGNDSMQGEAGNDLLDGGAGSNTAFYAQPASAYVLGVNAYGNITVRDTLGSEGTDTLVSVQKIAFAGSEISIASAAKFGEVRAGNAFNAGSNVQPNVAALVGGGHVVVWDAGNNVYVQRYDSLGNGAGVVTSISGSYGQYSDVAALADGGFAVSYYGYEPQDGSFYGARVRRYDANGGAVAGGSVRVSDPLDSSFTWDTNIAPLASGGYVVTWARSSSTYDIYATVVSADNVVGTQIDLSATAPGVPAPSSQYYPSIAGLTGGGFVAAWNDVNNGGAGTLRLFDSAGVALGAAVAAAPGFGFNMGLTALVDGGFILFSQGSDLSSTGIVGRRYDAVGVAVGGSFIVNTTTANQQGAPNAAGLADGGFVVVWESDRQDGSDYGIYGQRYAADGSLLGAEFRVNGTTTNAQRDPDVASSGTGFVVSWRSAGATGGVYTQRFDAEGNKIGGLSVTGSTGDDDISAADALQSVIVDGGEGDDALIGGAVADTVAGGAGDDTVTGGAGADRLEGGDGDDVYEIRVQNANDTVAGSDTIDTIVEQDDGGIDTVLTYVGAYENSFPAPGVPNTPYTLPETSVERLYLMDGGLSGIAQGGVGNSLDNLIVGNRWANSLAGAGGNDTLDGGRDYDVARFSGELAEYVFGVTSAGAITVRHAAAADGSGDGTDVLRGIDAAVFAGSGFAGPSIALGTVATAGVVSRVNPSTTQLIQSTKAVALGDGSTLAIWYASANGTVPGTVTAGLYGQRINAEGQAIDGNGNPGTNVVAIGEVTFTPGVTSGSFDFNTLQVVRNGAGAVVAWRQNVDPDAGGPNPNQISVQTRLIGADGTPLGMGPTQVGGTVQSPDSLYYFDLAAQTSGGYMLLRQEYVSLSGTLFLTTYQFDAAGNGTATLPLPNVYNQNSLALADGGWLAMNFASGTNPQTLQNEYFTNAQRYAANGTTVGAAFELSERIADAYSASSFVQAALAGGGRAIAWMQSNGSDQDVFMRVLDANFAPVSAPMLLNEDISYDQRALEIAALAGGGFVAAWTHVVSGLGDVYARIFDAWGNPQGASFVVNAVTTNNQTEPSIAAADDGSFTIFYADQNSGSRGVWAQRFDADGRKTGGLDLTGTFNNDVLKASDAVMAVAIDGQSGNDSLLGGAAADTLEGGTGNDTMDGGPGVDSLIGGNGNDVYIYDGTADVFVEAPGQGLDTVRALANYVLPDSTVTSIENVLLTADAPNALNATGNERPNTLTGNALANRLDGGAGIDNLVGGAGDDTYVVDAVGDVVTEAADAPLAPQGIDTIESSVSYTLSANVERLVLTGSDPLYGAGNALDNTLVGNDGANVLVGFAGNDVYEIGVSDTVTEDSASAGGVDTIKIDANYSLVGIVGVENLILTGSGDTSGTGNALANAITGTSGNNSLTGGAGADTLVGAAGIDTLAGGSQDDLFLVGDSADQVQEDADGGTDTVRADVSYALPTGGSGQVENLELVGENPIDGTGNELPNRITGNAFNNVLDGGAGGDTLTGLAGNDTYVVDSPGDSVVEAANGGSDTVQSSEDLFLVALAPNVENLVLTGAAANGGRGNTLDNTLTGNSAGNQLDGGTGADSMIGGGGDDTYLVDNAGDVITELAGEGADTAQVGGPVLFVMPSNLENVELVGTVSLNVEGNELDNSITGNTLSNQINGGAGADTMRGDKGDDFYIVDHALDLVIEKAGEGVDTVFSTLASYTLRPNVENLTLMGQNGDENLNGTGNFLSNVITGNRGNNVLDGGLFVDVLIGGIGNDTYYVDTGDDIVVENPGEGDDTVYSSVTYGLLDDVENLILTGANNIDGTGNGLANAITGNTGHNVLAGLAGNDTLTGGNGNDSLDGGGDVDSLIGGAGADTLEGGAGADNMAGNAGDDTYRRDDVGDLVTESASEGTDIVETSLDYTLVANVEDLLLLGSADLLATGNSQANKIFGNAGHNLMLGLGGDDRFNATDVGGGRDTMEGGSGSDIYYVDSLDDVVTELTGEGDADAVYAVGGAVMNGYTLPNFVEVIKYIDANFLYAIGNASNNLFEGNDGNNILDGAGGADTMVGGLGDDFYYVDSFGGNVGGIGENDQIVENSGEGTDTASASVDYTLAANVENLILTGSATQGTGNSSNNNLMGNTASNLLDGGAGADTMVGGAGDDVYVVDSSSDLANESGGSGTDTVRATASYALGTDLENLELAGLDNIAGVGNLQDNLITGNNGSNLIDGGAGVDLVSYAGAIGGVNVNLGTGQATGGGGNDTLFNVEDLAGSAYGDALAGSNGDNLLDGGAGGDNLNGGYGNDTYVVDDANDVIVEAVNAPAPGSGPQRLDLGQYAGFLDTVRASVSFSLGANLENLIQTGLANLTGTGNGLDNLLTGNTGNNTLQGLGGNDTLNGAQGNDVLLGGDGNDTGDGGDGDDTLAGMAGDDSIDGGNGIDAADYSGATDAPTVNLQVIGAQLVSALQGNDILTGIENLIGGLMADRFTGNTAANRLTGGAGHDTLDGFDGNDTIDGGEGDDSLVGGLNADSITGGNGNDFLSGGKGTDTLVGGDGNDTLAGGLGTDNMTGGNGADRFQFRGLIDGVINVDTVVDFASGTDVIEIWVAGSGMANLAGFIGQTINIDQTAGVLTYNAGTLGYDADGAAGSGATVNFAILGGAPVLGNDFAILA